MSRIWMIFAAALVAAAGCDDGGADGEPVEDAGTDGGGDDGLSFPLKIAVLSDTHLYAESLGMSIAASEALETEPGLAEASDAIVEATVEDLAVSDVDLVLVSGDLTSNGAAESHERIAALLGGLEDAGIQVLVVPGNHDVNNQYAVSYADFQDPVPDLTPEEFDDLYADLGPADALSEDPSSMSYSVEPIAGIRLLMIDSCLYTAGYHLEGALSDDTLAWATDQAVAAVSEGSFPIAVLHHGLVEHVDSQDTYFAGFLLNDHEAVATALADSGVTLAFTGHYHTRDTSMLETGAGNTLYDTETGSLTIWPFPYRLLTIEENGAVAMTAATTEEFDFDTGGQDIDTWAQERLDTAHEAYLTSVASGYGLTGPQIAAAMPTMKEAWKAHLLGDEEYTEERQAAVADISSQGGVMFLVGGMIAKMFQDAAPADNELTIDLTDGSHTP